MKAGCLAGFHCAMNMNMHMHAYCYPLFKVHQKQVCEQLLYIHRKDTEQLLSRLTDSKNDLH